MASSQGEAREQYFEGDVVAALPLALLESVRSHDRPGEILEDEDLTLSLPRRFGLSGVVETQIQRYESAQRAGRPVSLNEVLGLVRLVLRRPDAELILRETGQRIAQWRYDRVPRALARVYRGLPLRLAMFGIAKALGRTFRELRAGGAVHVHRHPLQVTASPSNTASLDGSGTACALFTAALEQQLRLYSGKTWRVQHSQCEARGARACEWRAEPA